MQAFGSEKLVLGPQNVVDGFGASSFGEPPQNLLDEQDVAGDPRAGKGGVCKTPYNPLYSSEWYSLSPVPFAIIDAGKNVTLSSVFFNHGWGSLAFNMSIGANPFNAVASWPVRVEGGGLPPCGPNCWQNVSVEAGTLPVNAVGQYIVVSLVAPTDGSLVELVLYGDESKVDQTTTSPPHPQKTSSSSSTLFSAIVGTNIVGAVSALDNLTAVTSVRAYNDWPWMEKVEKQNAFEPCYDDLEFFFDEYLGNFSKLGYLYHWDLLQTPLWLHENNASRSTWKALNSSAIFNNLSSDPLAYTALASETFQIAARYGSQSVNQDELLLAPGQPARSGLKTLEFLEVGNEWDGDWSGREAYYAPQEYAAALSAAYDGHCGAMGPGYGIKTADPNMGVSISGMASMGIEHPMQEVLDYLTTMAWWAKHYRSDGKFPAEVINWHHYCTKLNSKGQSQGGISPEECSLTQKLQNLTAWCDQFCPHCQVWLTEFGYDTESASPYGAPAIGSMSALTVQAVWLVRSYLAISASGISRAHQFMLRDVNSFKPYPYSTSGLLYDRSHNATAKPSWYYVSTLNAHLGAFTFQSIVNDTTTSPTITVASFTSTAQDRSDHLLALRSRGLHPTLVQTKNALAVWLPSSTDATHPSYALKLPCSSATTATLVRFADKHPFGLNATLPITNSILTLPNITETPQLIFC